MSSADALSPELQETVNRFIAVILNDIKNNCLKLPTLPEVATKVRSAVDNENSSTSQIAKVISTDTALTARLIQVANSPLYRARTPIDNVQSSITRLGMKTVRDLVTSLLMKQLYQTKSPMLRKRAEQLWLHSSEVAALSGLLARRYTSLSADEAMLAGLVHDIGAMPLIVRAEEFPTLVQNPAALEHAIETLHPQIGKLILETWHFPPGVVDAAAEHEQLDRYSAEVDYVDVVMVANLHSYMGKQHRLSKTDWGNVPAFGKLGLTPDQSLELMESTREEVAELKKVLAG